MSIKNMKDEMKRMNNEIQILRNSGSQALNLPSSAVPKRRWPVDGLSNRSRYSGFGLNVIKKQHDDI